MSEYFKGSVKYDKLQDNGQQKTVTEQYIVDAMSFTEAEARLIEEVTPFVTGDSIITSVKRTNIAEIADNDTEADNWYKCKLEFITVDEKTAKEKRSAFHILVKASNFIKAYENLMQHMKGSMSDFNVVSISRTNIMDVFKVDLSK